MPQIWKGTLIHLVCNEEVRLLDESREAACGQCLAALPCALCAHRLLHLCQNYPNLRWTAMAISTIEVNCKPPHCCAKRRPRRQA